MFFYILLNNIVDCEDPWPLIIKHSFIDVYTISIKLFEISIVKNTKKTVFKSLGGTVYIFSIVKNKLFKLHPPVCGFSSIDQIPIIHPLCNIDFRWPTNEIHHCPLTSTCPTTMTTTCSALRPRTWPKRASPSFQPPKTPKEPSSATTTRTATTICATPIPTGTSSSRPLTRSQPPPPHGPATKPMSRSSPRTGPPKSQTSAVTTVPRSGWPTQTSTVRHRAATFHLPTPPPRKRRTTRRRRVCCICRQTTRSSRKWGRRRRASRRSRDTSSGPMSSTREPVSAKMYIGDEAKNSITQRVNYFLFFGCLPSWP